MRLLLLFTLIVCYHGSSMAENKPTKEEGIKWLRENLIQERTPRGKKAIVHNYTQMCAASNLHKAKPGEIESKNFKTKIESYVSWNRGGLEIQNDIYEHGKLKETYTYQVPLSAITGAHVTNCELNPSKNVDAYADRPIFIAVKKNTTGVGYTRFDQHGKAISNDRGQYHMNSKDGDWESVIPIAGNWDHDENMLNKTLAAFASIAAINH